MKKSILLFTLVMTTNHATPDIAQYPITTKIVTSFLTAKDRREYADSSIVTTRPDKADIILHNKHESTHITLTVTMNFRNNINTDGSVTTLPKECLAYQITKAYRNTLVKELSIINRIIYHMGGNVKIDSPSAFCQLDEGTIFRPSMNGFQTTTNIPREVFDLITKRLNIENNI